MAEAGDIGYVRKNVGEDFEGSTYTDDYIGDLIDQLGVTSSVVSIWREKAASYSMLVNVSEAGSSHSASDLFKHASEMLDHWNTTLDVETVDVAERPRIRRVIRT